VREDEGEDEVADVGNHRDTDHLVSILGAWSVLNAGREFIRFQI
jgi:hypothetical protein